MGVLVVLVLAGIGFAMWRYRIPPRGLVAMFAALGYLVFPVDVVPEALLGPLGLADDAGVLALVAVWVWRLTRARNRLVEGGIIGPDGRLGHRRRPRDTDQV
ncbi:DUF1232 domain-containing protein [Nocardioides sp. YIM 123512]|uniref:DUF1232 domain-containing protein n=2 Tax=Nocardioides flavescens TaxID=2691959 RepID=A0A6L7EXW9_9ACTN|nr:DUF1232 domain-containing protein [Nocardioides flavescens]